MPKTLLLADDSVTIQKVVGISFANEDIVLLTVDNGDDAIRRAREARPDIILADVVMPGKNGYEVCEAIKADAELSSIPVLLLTGTFEAFDEDRASRAGADGHITKPFEAQSLVDQVNSLLSGSAPPAATREPERAAPADDVSPSADTAYDFFDDEAAPPEVSGSPEETMVVAEPPPAPAESGDPSETMLLGAAPADDDAFGFEEDGDLGGDLPREQRPTTPLVDGMIPAPDADDGATVALLHDAPTDSPLSSASAPASSDLDLDLTPPAEPVPSFGMDDLDPGADIDPQEQSAARLFDDPPPAPGDAGETRILSEGEGLLDTPFDAAPEAPEPMDLADAAPAVEAEDVMGAAVLDPAAGDDYDVSSSDLGTPVVAPPAPEASPAPSGAATELSPELRTELHDVIEKIAWEAFGQLTEKLVKDAVERVERVAWEVVPQLTEALLKEEIRKLKGD